MFLIFSPSPPLKRCHFTLASAVVLAWPDICPNGTAQVGIKIALSQRSEKGARLWEEEHACHADSASGSFASRVGQVLASHLTASKGESLPLREEVIVEALIILVHSSTPQNLWGRRAAMIRQR